MRVILGTSVKKELKFLDLKIGDTFTFKDHRDIAMKITKPAGNMAYLYLTGGQANTYFEAGISGYTEDASVTPVNLVAREEG